MTARAAGAAVTAAPVRFNPFDPSFRADPYPQYRVLREHAPVHRALGMWVLTRHADVTAVLHDRTTSVDLIPGLVDRQTGRLIRTRPDAASPATLARIGRLARTSLVFTDDPQHTRLRTLAGRVFTPRALAALREPATEAARRLVAALERDGGGDAVAAVAAPLPLTVLCDAFGVPDDLREHVGDWTHRVRFLLEPGLLAADDLGDVATAVDAFVDALGGLVATRRRHPGDDLVSALAAARTFDGEALDEDELVFVVMMAFIAGLETTTALIGNGLHALLAHPDQAARLRAEPDAIPAAVVELLRHDSPLQLTKRLTTRETELGDAIIPAGAQVLLCLGAANRDPAVYADPDALDLTRPVTRGSGAHLAYGRGMHGCVGAALASLVAEVALEALLTGPTTVTRGPGPVTWLEHSQIVRGVATLPVVVR